MRSSLLEKLDQSLTKRSSHKVNDVNGRRLYVVVFY